LNKFSSQIAMFDNSSEMSSVLLFDPKDPIVYVADEKHKISAWDYTAGYQSNCFANYAPDGPRVTTMCVANEGMSSLLMVGGDDGVAKVWSNAHVAQGHELLTAWTVVPDLLSVGGGRGPGLILDWHQESSMLMASGSVDKVKVWDVQKQLCVQDVATGTEYPVTAMTTGKGSHGRLLWVGSGDGKIGAFDCRTNSLSRVLTVSEHSGPVICLHQPRWNGSSHMLVSGAAGATASKGSTAAGAACFWDIRNMASPMRVIETGRQSETMTAMAVHNYAPVFACGSHKQAIKVFDLEGKELNRIRYHEGFLGQRIGPVSCLAFHPHQSYLAAGAVDAYVALFKGQK